MATGSMTFVLHSHMPYCRLAGRWPHGEEWFHEAMLECYLPLLGALRRLGGRLPAPLGVTMNITPILAEQMADPLMLDHFRTYLADRQRRASTDMERFSDESEFAATAQFHAARYQAASDLLEHDLRGDIIAGFRALEDSGHIEIATCAATHGYLPLLGDDDAIRFQVETGVRTHERLFGQRPRSFWLPECAYRPGLETFLQEAGIELFFVETHLVTGGHTRGKALGGVHGPYPEMPIEVPASSPAPDGPGTTFRAYTVGDSDVAVLARTERTGKQVWSATHGYPGDAAYREFHKKDEQTGLQYWRVTGPEVDLGSKAAYDPAAAAIVTRNQAGHFPGIVVAELDAYRRETGRDGLVMASYDTELFGHWWLEGVNWLEQTIANLASEPGVELLNAEQVVARGRPLETISMPEGSWGGGGDHRTWLNEATAWTWPEVQSRQARAKGLLGRDDAATRQLARELLLLQSSDWQFLITTEQAREYATERFREHCARFDRIASAIETRDPGLGAIVRVIGEIDNPFADIQPLLYAHARELAPA